MKTKLIEEQKRIYQRSFDLFGDSARGTYQNNQETQVLRFERVMKNILPQNRCFSIHDVGSGVAELHQFLLNRHVEHAYSGTEIVADMISKAKARFPYIEINNRDILTEDIEDKYEYVVLSGVFNLPGSVEEDDWKLFCFSMIKKMYEMCTDGMVFNFLTTHNTFTAPDLYYFHPMELFQYCVRNLSRFVLLDHAYPLYEGTITVFTENHIQKRFNKK